VLFDPRLHPTSLSEQDLETLLAFGVTHAVLVADSSFHPATPRTILKHFDDLLARQQPRFERAGLRTWVALGVHPAVLPRRGLGEVIESLPRYLSGGHCVAVGLIGLSTGDEAECDAVREQLAFARRFRLAALIASPKRNREVLTRKVLQLLKCTKNIPKRILIDGATETTVKTIRELGIWAGLTAHPDHLDAAKVVKLVRALGGERLVLNSGAGEGGSDLLALPHAVHLLEKNGLSPKLVELVSSQNAANLLGLRID
jgi:predicted metal-dependent TIM-barrel fold hydrolase